MTEERLKEIYRDVSHSAHEEMSTDNIHLMAMKQAVNEAIDEFKKQCEFYSVDGSFMFKSSEFNKIADQLKVK